MELSPTLDTVLQAISALYHNPEPTIKEKASFWLEELQRSVHAWEVSNELLQRKLDLESCYFAAQTMRTKIQCAFHELPPASHQSLRDSLLGHISLITQDTNQTIVTQLCLALADLALQMSSWKGAIQDVISRFGNEVHLLSALLEILTVLPEEVSSRSLRLGANRREEMTKEFNLAAPYVMQLLNACTDNYSSDPRVMHKVMRCSASWFVINAIPTEDLAQSKLLLSIFRALVDPTTAAMVHEVAADCVCSALLLIEDVGRHLVLAQVLCQGVWSCVDAYHLSVASEDVDKSINYCRMFTELGEAFLEMLVDHPGQGLGDLRMVDVILICTGHHDYEVSEITFNFWYRLSEILYKTNDENISATFRPYVERLITALCRHCQMEPDHEGIPEDGDDFNDFRLRVSELIRDVVFLVGSSNCFRQMFNNLKNQSQCATWDISEASLFVMTAVAKNILPEESEVVPQVVDAILNLPDNTHEAVKYTSIQLIGELSEWIEKHPAKLDPVLNFLLSGLQQKQLATAAANSLQCICSTCREKMGNHFQGIVQIITAMDSFSISDKAAIELLKGAAVILAGLPVDQITSGFKVLCNSQISLLSEVVRGESQAKGDCKLPDPALWLDRLAAIFRHTNPIVTNGEVHPCQSVINEIWPVISETCNKYQSDGRIIERCCRCIRFAIRCLGKQSAPILEPLVKQMVLVYQLHQHSCFLYLGSILVDEYGSEPGCAQGLLDMLHAFCGPTFKILEELNGLRNHPDTVDDLFRLCTRFIQRLPVLFMQSTVMKPIFQCALAAISLDHREANGSVTKFLYDIVRSGRVREEQEDFEMRKMLIRNILVENGQLLVTNLLNASLFSLRSYMLADIADVFYELMIFDRPVVCKWLENSLKVLPTHGCGGSITATHKQLTDFHKAATIAESDKQVRIALQDFSRLFR